MASAEGISMKRPTRQRARREFRARHAADRAAFSEAERRQVADVDHYLLGTP
jgi:hypothetical protein